MRCDPKLLESLEPTQFTAQAERPLRRRKLGRLTRWMLISLRVYVLIAIPIVAYAFVHALGAAH